jgi:hypothetical protein
MIPKFRAWDKILKKMNDVTAIDFSTKPFRVFYSAYGEDNYFNQDAILMQSTGLKDKNGVEIYEGDILLSAASENQEDWKKWQVHYADGRFLVDYKQTPKDKRKRKNLEIEDLCEDNVWLYGLEVIGNIYETPELRRNKNDSKEM